MPFQEQNTQKQILENVEFVSKKDKKKSRKFSLNFIKRKLPVDNITKIRYFLRKWILLTFIGKQNLDIYVDSINRKNIDNSQDYCPLNFGSDEVVQISKPDNENLADIPSWWIENIVGSLTIPRPYVFDVQNAQLVGVHATGFTASDSIIRETTVVRAIPLERAVNIRTVVAKKLSKTKINVTKLQTVCSLVNIHSKNYSHWLIDCLARLELVEYYQKQTGIKPKLLIPSNPYSWQTESLRLMSYNSEDCVCWNTSIMEVERLVAPSFRLDSLNTNNYFNVSPGACHWLRDRIIHNLSIDKNSEHSFAPRVLLSRGKALRRRVINEDELTKALSPFGFVPYTLEEMSFVDQVRLFSQAEIVIGPHGAGFTNIIFSQNPNLIVVELIRDPFHPMFFYLSKLLGFKYYLFNCMSTSLQTKLGDVIVDINKLQKFVSHILNIN